MCFQIKVYSMQGPMDTQFLKCVHVFKIWNVFIYLKEDISNNCNLLAHLYPLTDTTLPYTSAVNKMFLLR